MSEPNRPALSHKICAGELQTCLQEVTTYTEPIYLDLFKKQMDKSVKNQSQNKLTEKKISINTETLAQMAY